MISVCIENSNTQCYFDESIYQLKLTQQDWNLGEDGTYKVDSKEIEAVRCSHKNITFIPDYYSNLDLENLYCLKNGNFSLEGDFSRKKWSILEFNFVRCKNSTTNNFGCKDPAFIEKKLEGGYF